MLARWCLDVGFQIIFFEITLILETDIVTFGPQHQSFGMPGASTLAPWGSMGRSRGTWGLKKGDFGVQARIFIDFGLISGSHFESFSGPLDQNQCFLMLVSRLFFQKILGSESGRLGLHKQAFGVRGVAKTKFSQNLEFR